MRSLLLNDVEAIAPRLAGLPTDWEGKASILAMKEARFNWRQMEWWAFYFELLCRRALAPECTFPGDKYRAVTFDMKRLTNWDLKAKAIKSDSHEMILNDQSAVRDAIAEHGALGVIVALCDVEYNDNDRSFQRWHAELKGGLSAYEKQRIARTAVSRYRKTHAWLSEILFLGVDASNMRYLGEMRQGINSNGRPRPPKFMLNLEAIEPFLVRKMALQA